MATRGRPCMVCQSPGRREVETFGRIPAKRPGLCERLGVSMKSIENHLRHHVVKVEAKAAPADVIPPPKLEEGATPAERAQAHVVWMLERLRAAQQSGDGKAIASLGAQYTAAMKYAARLNGAFDLTERQICNSTPFIKTLGVVRDALRAYPKALAAVEKALTEVVEGK